MASLLLLLYAAFRSIGNGVSSAALHCSARGIGSAPPNHAARSARSE